jgi:hypothetical protein
VTSGPRVEQALSNREIAAYLDCVAGLLAGQGATLFRVQADRKAAALIRELPVSVAELYRDAGSRG